MRKVFNLKSFWLISAATLVAVFVLSVNLSRVYEAKTDILIIPKSAVAVENANQIIENMQNLPTTLTFFNRMAEENADVANDTLAELPDYKKKIYWNSELNVSRVGNSGILQITARDKDRYRAEVLSSQTTKTLLGSVGLYYDIRNNLDVRIIDPTVTDYSAGTFNYMIFSEILLGVLVIIFLAFSAGIAIFEKEKNLQIELPNFLSNYENIFSLSRLKKEDAAPVLEKNDVAKSVPLEKEWTLGAEEKPYTDFVNRTKVASAPANLPIAEDETFLEVPQELPEKNKMPLTHEATDEEVKARLNKLLSGKL